MVTVGSGQGAPSLESGLHLALSTGACHALPALLAAEAPDRVPAFYVSGVDDGRNNRQNHQEERGDGDRSQNAVDHAVKDFGGGCSADAARRVRLRHERQED